MIRFLSIVLTGIIAAAMLSCGSNEPQEPANQVIYDENAGEKILYGKINTKAFDKKGFGWYKKGYTNYKVNKQVLDKLDSTKLAQIKVEIVLGTWCPDSRRELPHFFKIADYMGIPKEHITMTAVNRKFKAPDFKKGKNGITRVPTFIILHKGKEIGRIVESPENTLEQDLKTILNE